MTGPLHSQQLSDEVLGPHESARYVWDARWDTCQRADAVAIAERRLQASRHDLESVLLRIQRDAEWLGTASSFRARADADDAVAKTGMEPHDG